jgi:hypothetical protein
MSHTVVFGRRVTPPGKRVSRRSPFEETPQAVILNGAGFQS